MTPPATIRKPRARSQARIDSILDAARTLLAAEGVASLSIYSVAERAEIPPSSVYHFFASVPALLEALTADVHAAFRACLQAPIDHGALSGWRDLSRLVEQRMLAIYSEDAAARQLILAQHGLMGPMQSPLDISYLSDTVVMLRYFEADGVVRRALSVVKKRSGEHEYAIREFRLAEGGVQVGPPLKQFQGIFTGTPTYVGERKPLMADPDNDAG